ncbi:hypothetical protein D3C78_943840 [compost metagenome]
MQAREVLAQLHTKRATPLLQRAIGGQPMAAGGAGQRLHDEEAPADHLRIQAQPQRPGHLHAGPVNRTEHGKLLFATHARRHDRRRIGTQHPALTPVAHAGLQQPVLLDGTAGQALAALDDDALAFHAFGQVGGQCLMGIRYVDSGAVAPRIVAAC